MLITRCQGACDNENAAPVCNLEHRRRVTTKTRLPRAVEHLSGVCLTVALLPESEKGRRVETVKQNVLIKGIHEGARKRPVLMEMEVSKHITRNKKTPRLLSFTSSVRRPGEESSTTCREEKSHAHGDPKTTSLMRSGTGISLGSNKE